MSREEQVRQKDKDNTDVTEGTGKVTGDDDGVICPICMHEIDQVVHGPCRHGFCLACLERYLLSPPAYQASRGDLIVSSVATPTLGSCPMCRQELYLFDIEYASTGQKVHSRGNNSRSCSRNNDEFEQHDGNKDTILPKELKGSIFVESTHAYPGVVGKGSYHFPVQGPPYFDVSNIPEKITVFGENKDRVFFEDFHFHETSRTFAGILPCSKEMSLFVHHHVILSFSQDWRFVRQGAYVKRRRRNFDTTKDIQLAYSFDGDWKVIQNNLENEEFSRIFPVNKSIKVQGYTLVDFFLNNMCMIRPRRKNDNDDTCRESLMFLAIGKELVSSAENNKNLNMDQDVIPIGFEWTWVDPNEPDKTITWKREFISSTIPPDPATPLGGNSGRILLRYTHNPDDAFLAAQQQRSTPRYNPNTVWGNVFVQAFQVGLASYHFEPLLLNNQEGNILPNAYISYESHLTSRWPPLDNGQALPSRVQFHNKSFDAATRTFRGDILWQDDYGTSWNGMIRWKYEMVFDRDYTCIIGGQVMGFHIHHLNDEVGECMSRYGESLVYCNASLWQLYHDQAASDRDQGDDDGQRYRERSGALRVGLQRQGASVRTIAMMHSILTAANDPRGQNPIDYNL